MLRTAEAVNKMSGQLLALDCAVQELIRDIPESQRKAWTERLRTRVDQALQLHPGSGDMKMESAATLQLASLLEAAGHPPQR